MTVTLDQVAALFAGAELDQHYGEDISIRAHMLQCAELAVGEGAADALVAAALLHDIGWTMPGHHELAAAEWLAGLFDDTVTAPIRLHVAAKRWLVTTQPDYYDRLSAASRQTLALQGGTMSPTEADTFAADPHAAAALRLRGWDDIGKALTPPMSTFADYRPLLERLAGV